MNVMTMSTRARWLPEAGPTANNRCRCERVSSAPMLRRQANSRRRIDNGFKALEGIFRHALLAPLDVAVLHRAIEVDRVSIDILEQLQV